MPSTSRIPAYRLHKASGQARVIIDGQHHYLGRYNSRKSQEKYARLIAEHFSSKKNNGTHKRPKVTLHAKLPINQLILLYWRFAETYYVTDAGPTTELNAIRQSLRPLRELYGQTPVAEFGPRALKTVRQKMIHSGLCRTVINARINRIRRAFSWAVSEELIPSSVYEALRTVAGLRKGRTEARESEPVKPVEIDAVFAVLPHVSPVVAAMIRIQLLTGMRSGELVRMRPCDIDRTGDVWMYFPEEHKTGHLGHVKSVPLGPAAQDVLRPFLNRDSESYLFSPTESEEWRVKHRPPYHGRQRTTPVYPSELKARQRAKQSRKKRRSKRPKAEHYTTASYRRAIDYGIRRAEREGIEIPHWHPHQLRHTRATEIRSKYGIEAAQVFLGHARADVTQVYAERNLGLARRIAAEIG